MCVKVAQATYDLFENLYEQCTAFYFSLYHFQFPCEPSPCGLNAECSESNGAGACRCIDTYLGNPYEGCRPECVINTDCPPQLACTQNKCKDPCPGVWIKCNMSGCKPFTNVLLFTWSHWKSIFILHR